MIRHFWSHGLRHQAYLSSHKLPPANYYRILASKKNHRIVNGLFGDFKSKYDIYSFYSTFKIFLLHRLLLTFSYIFPKSFLSLNSKFPFTILRPYFSWELQTGYFFILLELKVNSLPHGPRLLRCSIFPDDLAALS